MRRSVVVNMSCRTMPSPGCRGVRSPRRHSTSRPPSSHPTRSWPWWSTRTRAGSPRPTARRSPRTSGSSPPTRTSTARW